MKRFIIYYLSSKNGKDISLKNAKNEMLYDIWCSFTLRSEGIVDSGKQVDVYLNFLQRCVVVCLRVQPAESNSLYSLLCLFPNVVFHIPLTMGNSPSLHHKRRTANTKGSYNRKKIKNKILCISFYLAPCK